MSYPIDPMLQRSRIQSMKKLLAARQREPLWDWLRWFACVLLTGDNP